MEETDRRRGIQMEYNRLHNITPQTIVKDIAAPIAITADDTTTSKRSRTRVLPPAAAEKGSMSKEDRIAALEKEMRQAAAELRFEEAAYLRDRIRELQTVL